MFFVLSVLHACIHFGVVKPHRMYLQAQVRLHSANHPHLALPHVFGHYGRRGEDEEEGAMEDLVEEADAMNEAALVITRFLRTAATLNHMYRENPSLTSGAGKVAATRGAMVAVAAGFGKNTRKPETHTERKKRLRVLHNMAHPVVHLAHVSAYAARPIYYVFSTVVHGIMDSNEFPQPELFVLGVIYQGVCQSSSSLEFSKNPYVAAYAAIIFVLLPLGFIVFMIYHCVYQVWWLGRAVYVKHPKKRKAGQGKGCCCCFKRKEEPLEDVPAYDAAADAAAAAAAAAAAVAADAAAGAANANGAAADAATREESMLDSWRADHKNSGKQGGAADMFIGLLADESSSTSEKRELFSDQGQSDDLSTPKTSKAAIQGQVSMSGECTRKHTRSFWSHSGLLPLLLVVHLLAAPVQAWRAWGCTKRDGNHG
jgi:hypothetical protein